MKQTRIVTLLCLIAGIASAQQQNMRGSDTLALYTRGLITDLGLGSQLNYLGGGSGLGIADAINSRTTGQTVNPASRAVIAAEVNAAAANNLRFVDYVLGLDGIVITVNDANLTGIRFSDIRHIYKCEWTNWTSVPTSTRTDDILAMARDENSGTTAAIPNPIGFSGAPGLASGNRDLLISNDNVNPPTPLVRFSEASVRDLSYQFARQLHMYKVVGISDGYGPTGAQATLLVNGAQNCGCNCPRLAANGFFAVTADYCATCTATCP